MMLISSARRGKAAQQYLPTLRGGRGIRKSGNAGIDAVVKAVERAKGEPKLISIHDLLKRVDRQRSKIDWYAQLMVDRIEMYASDAGDEPTFDDGLPEINLDL